VIQDMKDIDDTHKIQPRFEFRAFAQNFGLAEDKLRGLSKFDKFRESSEIYIVSADNSETNIKIRDDKLDIKVLVKIEKGLEQWNPQMKAEFPIRMEEVRDELFPALNAAYSDFNRCNYTAEQFLDEIIRPHPKLCLARVFKRRFGYIINGCSAELAELLINGAAIKTVATESIDADAVLKTKAMLGLHEYENVNYLLAIKRILGVEPL
jgi:hypothetical protein